MTRFNSKKNRSKNKGGRMKVLIACEYSGIVREAFKNKRS